MTEAIRQLEDDQRRWRRMAFVRQVLDTLRETAQLRGLTPGMRLDDVRINMTDASVKVIVPLVEAVMILEEIVWASDGCMGHRECAHSMEPWQRARALLQGKWEAENSFGEQRWP